MRLEALPRQVAVFDRTDELAHAGHEQIVFCRDDASGLKAIIAIHSTRLGPALGGTRFYPYDGEADALHDVLRLSQGMTFKNAAAGMSLGGYYITAADVGANSDDLDMVRENRRHVVGTNVADGGSGDGGLSAARGVFFAIRAAAEHLWGPGGIQGRVVGFEGAGKVGHLLLGLLLDARAHVFVADPSDRAIGEIRALYGDSATVVSSFINAPLDLYAPCALGGTLTEHALGDLRAALVCGAANNQLATRDVDSLLFERGVTWVLDYVVNAGGVIQVGGELWHRTADDVLAQVRRIADATREVLTRLAKRRISTGRAAAAIGTERMQCEQQRRRVSAGLVDCDR